FLHTLGTHWNISLFHYRSHGTDYGRVLAAFELGDHEPDFETRMPLDMPESVLVRFKGKMQPGITLRDLVHAIPLYAIKQGLLTV
ncbi:hypothetical protein MJL33_30005, partial [Salmonella enterica subsp. enterica serovar Kentucky]|nr:hypothetical protein [Salmonella enterica subsp. enterica serovar Kentucky]